MLYQNITDFLKNSTLSSDVFLVRKSVDSRFQTKIQILINFRFDTPTQFPESESKQHFQVSGMRAIDFPLKITS